MLIAAVSAALATGVLIAHAICLSMFTLFRIHATQVAARRALPVPQSQLTPIGN